MQENKHWLEISCGISLDSFHLRVTCHWGVFTESQNSLESLHLRFKFPWRVFTWQSEIIGVIFIWESHFIGGSSPESHTSLESLHLRFKFAWRVFTWEFSFHWKDLCLRVTFHWTFFLRPIFILEFFAWNLHLKVYWAKSCLKSFDLLSIF